MTNNNEPSDIKSSRLIPLDRYHRSDVITNALKNCRAINIDEKKTTIEMAKRDRYEISLSSKHLRAKKEGEGGRG